MSYLSSRRVFKRAQSFTGIALTLLMVFQALGPGVFALRTAHAASTVFSDGFGTGDTDTTFGESPSWNEGGEGAEKRAIGSGNDSVSPNGGRFATIFGEDGWICREIDATGFFGLMLSYNWRGDSDAESNDDGIVEYKTSGSCGGSGWNNLKSHDMSQDGSWNTQTAFALPSSLDDSEFLIRFRVDSSQDDEHFRVDGILIEGEEPELELFFSCKIEGSGSIWFVKNHSGSDIDFDWEILPNADSGSGTADYSNPFHDTQFKTSAQGTAEITWQQGNQTFTDQETMGDRICKGRLTVVKEVVGGDAQVGDFNLYIDGNSVTSGQEIEVTAESPNVHTITEDNLPNYTSSFSSNCANGEITVGFEEEETCTITNTYEAPQIDTGTIRVCKIILDHEGNVITGEAGTTFTIPWLDEDYEGPAVANLPADAVFTTPIGPLVDLFGDDALEGQCLVYDDLPVGRYYYGEEVISPNDSMWETPLYHDEFTGSVSGFGDFGLFNTDLDAQYDDFDGVINISKNSDRTLIVLNQLKAPAAQCIPDLELIKNGSFEDPEVTDGAEWDIFDSGTLSLEWVSNWMRTGGGEPSPASLELHAGVNSWAPSAGSQYAELDGDWTGPGGGNGEDASTYIYQDIPTVPGETYTLSFDFSPRPNTGASNNVLGVSWNGTDFPLTPLSGGNATNQTTWSNHVFSFEATSTVTRLQFEDRGTGDSLGTFLDNVSLKCEEPEKCEETSGSIVSDDSVVVTHIDINGATSTPNTNAEEVSVVAQIQSLGANVWDADVGDANANWIWSEDPYDANWEVDKWVTFTKNFTVDGEAQSSSLKIAADNEYEVWVNGVLVNSDFSEDNHSVADGSFDVTAHLVNGNNTLEVRVKNIGLPGNNQENNPGGLLFALSWTAKDCDPNDGGGDPDPDPQYTVTFHKYIDGQTASTGEFEIEWDYSNLNQQGAGYLLDLNSGNSYTASTGLLDEESSVTWNETSSNDMVVSRDQCEIGKFVLAGYIIYEDGQSPAGNPTNINSIGSLSHNMHVNVYNETCPTPPDCVEGLTWAASVEDYDQGKRKNGSDVLLSRSNPSSVLGTPDGNGGSNTGFFSLGEDGTITVEFDHYVENVDGDDLSFHEITNGRDSYPEEKAFVEVSQNGTDWEDVGTVSSKDGTVSYLDFDSTGFDWIRYVRITDTTDFSLHSNDADGYDLDAVDATWGLCEEPKDDDGGNNGGGEMTFSYATTTIYHTDLATGFADLISDITKWFFYNDENDTIDNNLGSFVLGPDTAPLSIGSGEMTVTGTERKNFATYQFKDVKLSDIKALRFSTYSQSAGNGSPGSERSAYLHFNVDFVDSDLWQNRLVYVPSVNGVVVNDTWQEWDAINGGSALWCWSGMSGCGGGAASWPAQTGTPFVDSTAQYQTWSDIVAAYPDIQTRSTDSWFGFRVGEPYGDGFTGNLDDIVIAIKTGLNTHTETYDLEPAPITPTITSTGGGTGGGSRSGGNGPVSFIAGASTGDPEVLGAAIDLPGLPNTGNGENSQFAATFLALIVSLLALNYFGLKALKRG